MNTQTHIPNTGGSTGEKHLQNVSSQANHNVREAAGQADQPISQEAANPAIQGHLAAAPGNMGELEAMAIAQDPKVNIYGRLEAAKLIKDDTQRDAFCFSITQDPKEPTYNRLNAAKLIKDDTQRDAICLSIAQDPTVSSHYRMRAVELIQDSTQRDPVCLSIAQDPTVDTKYRMKAAKQIKDVSQYSVVYAFCLSVAQDTEVKPTYRLDAAGLINDKKIQEEACLALIECIFSVDDFKLTDEWVDHLQENYNIQMKDIFIKAICQNWPLVEDEQFQSNLATFRGLYNLASDYAVKAELITAIVSRTELDARFRKAVVEENVKDSEQRDCLLKVIEEKQEGSLSAPRTKRAR